MAADRQMIFVSYSHDDVGWLDRLTLVLTPMVGQDRIRMWDDRRIQPGAQWQAEIDEALNAADAAVLLVSASFLASPFISGTELPAILRRWKHGQLAVVWVAVSPALYEATPLSQLQAANDPELPLSRLDDSAVDAELVRIARLITSGSAVTAVGRALKTVDSITYQLAEMTGEAPRTGPPSVVAAPVDGTVELHRQVAPGGPAEVVERITPEDLVRLTDRERQLIDAFEETMYRGFDRWTDLYRRRAALTASERQEMQSSAKQMCHDLTNIIDFLDGIGKNLTDHYMEVKFICNNVAAM